MEINWLTPIICLAIYGFVRYLAPYKSDDTKTGIHWSPLESVAITAFIYLFGQIIGGLLIFVSLSLFGWNSDRTNYWLSQDVFGQFMLTALIQLLGLALLMLFLKRRQANLGTIGLKARPQWRDLGYAAVGFLGYMVAYVVLATFVKQLIPAVNFEQKQEIGFDNVRQLQLPLVFISLVILPPLVEEITMRGFLYGGLSHKLPKLTAALVTSGLFAIAHLQAGTGNALLWVAAIDTFVLSLVLIRLREKTGRLWAPIILHGLKNLIAFVSIFIFHLA